MRASERFLEYAKVYTTSDAACEAQSPSSARQFALAEKLAEELRGLGAKDAFVSEQCYVYAHLPATAGCENAASLGFIAHMDTSPDAPGENVRPLVHENYGGGNVALPGGHVIDAAVFDELPALAGQTLITADGSTLLGADDKAGIAEIMTLCEVLQREGTPHGRLCIAFTPDEEIGNGAKHFDLGVFGAAFAYTVDGGAENEIEYECFNAAAAEVTFRGISVHPGTAKGLMVNAAGLATELDALLPQDARPQNTEGREGFFHLCSIEGAVDSAKSEYIIRDHDRALFEGKKQVLRDAVAQLQRRYGEGHIALSLSDTYYNMGEVIAKHFHLVENAQKAMREVGLEPLVQPIRGGTDGSRLSFEGLPCPNLGTGGHYFHGLNECITAEAMDKVVQVLVCIAGLYAAR